jgi:FtsP/CotA-like multicopper oxidase with cupredoxin domain
MTVIDWTKTGISGEVTYSTFGCNVFKEAPPTPDKLTPDVVIQRRGAETGDMRTPDGGKIKIWGFVDSSLPLAQQKLSYPSPTIRVKQGQIVHSVLTTAKGPHTIHHHGIEPTTANDGVGHVSFEVNDTYTYQWQPMHAGTFFYHCHRNTVLHFEMGMLGLLIVDPPTGKGKLYANGPSYTVERAWVADDMDPKWHQIADHDAGLCGLDVGLNRFDPKYFLLNGIFSTATMTDAKVTVAAKLGQKILIRLLNASYSVLRVTLGCDAMWACADGHAMGVEPWCDTKILPAGVPFEMSTAQRYDLILSPPARGTYLAKMEFLHWISGQIQNNGAGVIQTKVVVS